VPRVLVGDFGAIARLGLEAFLDEEGFEVVAREHAPRQLFSLLTAVHPDVVVLDLDNEWGPELARRIISVHPGIKVIACSAEHPTMRVYPPFQNGASYESALSPELLAEAVRS